MASLPHYGSVGFPLSLYFFIRTAVVDVKFVLPSVHEDVPAADVFTMVKDRQENNFKG